MICQTDSQSDAFFQQAPQTVEIILRNVDGLCQFVIAGGGTRYRVVIFAVDGNEPAVYEPA